LAVSQVTTGLAAHLSPWWIALAAVAAATAAGAVIRQVANADAARRAAWRETCGALVQYVLLFGFAAVAVAISAHGLIGFARASMGLRGAWPFLLWAALDGAAGLCAVLLLRRAARGESALAPRLAVWGLVAASSAFNWSHAPRHPGARAAFALMPVIAAVLFEFSLRETRYTARRGDRQLTGLRWLHPVERIRVQLELAAEDDLTVAAATRRVRVRQAAWSLHRLRRLLADPGRQPAGAGMSRLARRAERRAQIALTRAGFADPAVADDVLRLAAILGQTVLLAAAGYHPPGAASSNGHQAGTLRQAADRLLIDAASQIVTQARQEGLDLSQAGLARDLRARGLSIANDRLRWLAAVSGLKPGSERG
jgi:hypothetical protein